MEKLVTLRFYNEESPEQTNFVDALGNRYSLHIESFLKEKNNGYSLESKFNNLFEAINENGSFCYYKVELNVEHEITKLIELPMQTKEVIEFQNGNRFSDNYALAINKAGRFIKDKLEYMNHERTNLFHPFNYANYRNISRDIHNKKDSLISQLEKQNFSIVRIHAEQTWRMATGLGNASAYNNGFTFHPVYGIPYIPGQAIKGTLRSFVIRENFYDEGLQGNEIENRAMQDPVFCYIFGCTKNSYNKKESKGNVDFLDVFPVGNFKIVPDIMNPHFSDYYNDENNPPQVPPADWIKPIPIVFLTLKDATFDFDIAIKKNKNVIISSQKFYNHNNDEIESNITDFTNKTPSQIISEWLPEALTVYGVGAKTSVGYGLMDAGLSQTPQQKIKQTEELAKQERNRADEEKTIAIKNGLGFYIKDITEYSELMRIVDNWLAITAMKIVEGVHKEVLLAKIAVIYSKLKGTKKKHFKDEPKRKKMESWIGIEVNAWLEKL